MTAGLQTVVTGSMGSEGKAKLIIRPGQGRQMINFRELLEYRDLLYFLVARDLKVRYKQTVLGGLWAIIQPLFSMAVFTVFFGKLAKMPSDGIPYTVFNFAAMVAWTYLANVVTGAGNSLITDVNLISKVYFPRLMIPLAPAIAGILDFTIASVVLAGMLLYYHIYPTAMILLLPFLLLMMIFTACGAGIFLAALNAKYRDIRYTIPFMVQLWMFASPIVYPASIVPAKYQYIYALNPMVGIIEGMRSILLRTVPLPTQNILISALVSSLLFIGGIFYFKQVERYFADII